MHVDTLEFSEGLKCMCMHERDNGYQIQRRFKMFDHLAVIVG